MTCIFCIAAMEPQPEKAILAQDLKSRLSGLVAGAIRLVADTDSVIKLSAEIAPDGSAAIPVSVTFFREFKRFRIQVLSHSVSRRAIEQVEDRLAEALGARIVSRSDDQSEAKARHAHEELEAERRAGRRSRPLGARP